MSWLSKQLEKSKRKGTGIYSWGESDWLKVLDAFEPGLGTGLDSAADSLGGKGKLPKPKFMSSGDVANQQLIMIFGGIAIIILLTK